MDRLALGRPACLPGAGREWDCSRVGLSRARGPSRALRCNSIKCSDDQRRGEPVAAQAQDVKVTAPAQEASDAQLSEVGALKRWGGRHRATQDGSLSNKPAAASRQQQQQLEGDSLPKNDRRRQPKSPETRAKMSAARKALLERLGGTPDEWRSSMSEAASNRKWSLDVRYRMSRSHAGKAKSAQARQNMSAGQTQRRERERRERATAIRGGRSSAAVAMQAPVPQLSEDLAREKAVIELSKLRQVVFGWMKQFQEVHGRQPSVQETAELKPDVYRAFVRYVALREMLRS